MLACLRVFCRGAVSHRVSFMQCTCSGLPNAFGSFLGSRSFCTGQIVRVRITVSVRLHLKQDVITSSMQQIWFAGQPAICLQNSVLGAENSTLLRGGSHPNALTEHLLDSHAAEKSALLLTGAPTHF